MTVKVSLAKLMLVVMMGVFVFGVVAVFAGRKSKVQMAGESSRQPVIVELFTSEGCSSCPPADALLQKLQTQQPVANAQIIALEEHVDYWNQLGWMDPFSSPEWTGRQQTYAALFGDDAYTPEMVIDGRIHFVGNDSRQAATEIERAAEAAKTNVVISPTDAAPKGTQRFHVQVEKMAENLIDKSTGDEAEVWLAVTEDGLHSKVDRGENSGRVLQHVATLRSLRKIGVANRTAAPDSFSNDVEVKFDPRWRIENLHVSVFVQKKKSREILGAATTKIAG
jgi:hypothetical protein